jgi:flagellar hook-associated protein 1
VSTTDSAVEADAGVNLDEEMTNMLLYQRAYQASARVITTMDEMLDTLVNRTGLVGR